LKDKPLEDIAIGDDKDFSENPLLGSTNVELGSQETVTLEAVKTVTDNSHICSIANAVGRSFDATIAGLGDIETVLARTNHATATITAGFLDVRESLAIRAIGDVIPEGRSNSAATTTLWIVEGVNAVEARPLGDTTHGLASSASRPVILSLGGALRTTSVREGPADTITLGGGPLANTLGRVCTWGRSVTVPARETARTLDAAEGCGVRGIVTLLLMLLALDESGEVIASGIRTEVAHNIPRHRIAVKETREDS